ncbi:MAG: hypothetical protein QOH88_998 [Verrucomicrobiota bacterium]|jgi:hypothetical protein
MKMEAAGLITSRLRSGPALAYGFMFLLKQPIQMTRVRVEDITDKQPVLLIDDHTPKIADNRWKGNTRAVSMSREEFPWMFDGATTKKLFRITIFTIDQGEIVLEQPATYDATAKKWMTQTTPKLKKTE